MTECISILTHFLKYDFIFYTFLKMISPKTSDNQFFCPLLLYCMMLINSCVMTVMITDAVVAGEHWHHWRQSECDGWRHWHHGNPEPVCATSRRQSASARYSWRLRGSRENGRRQASSRLRSHTSVKTGRTRADGTRVSPQRCDDAGNEL